MTSRRRVLPRAEEPLPEIQVTCPDTRPLVYSLMLLCTCFRICNVDRAPLGDYGSHQDGVNCKVKPSVMRVGRHQVLSCYTASLGAFLCTAISLSGATKIRHHGRCQSSPRLPRCLRSRSVPSNPFAGAAKCQTNSVSKAVEKLELMVSLGPRTAITYLGWESGRHYVKVPGAFDNTHGFSSCDRAWRVGLT
jgi:hypothetical protein